MNRLVSSSQWPRYLAVLIPLIIFLSCAEIKPPPGGEVDRTGPVFVESEPANGAVGVAPSDRIIIRFSEELQAPDNKRIVYISPRSDEAPRIKFKGDRIIITTNEVFRDNQTYIVSVGTDVQDYRRNRLDSAVTIAFSTGDRIDTGVVAGTVLRAMTAAGGLMVGLYNSERITDSVTWDSLYPDYVTSTGTKGEFKFQYLPDADYRLVAFQDKNRSERLNPTREDFAVSDRPIRVGGELGIDHLTLGLTHYDTLPAQILSVSRTPDNLVRLRMSKPVPTDFLAANPSSLLLHSMEDSLRTYPASAILEWDKPTTDILTAQVENLPQGAYSIVLAYDLTLPEIRFDSTNLMLAEDKTGPAITAFTPDAQPQFLEEVKISLTFSEPIDTAAITDQTMVLWGADSTLVPLVLNWTDAFHLALMPDELLPGTRYSLGVTEFEIRDMAGNALGDSLRSYAFTILDADSLGSVTGEVDIQVAGKDGDPLVLTFSDSEARRSYTLHVDGRQFNKELPPGRYLITGFVDSDLDGQWSLGGLFPFSFGETYISHPDTVAVRARFETAGVTITVP
ncbi:MAG: Ig-like domain-containing protein [candidate division Zixibacteria bacterium]|nr:Ig-like domain-containing protein [candidate division Zixibacteria bacterium]